MSRPVWHFLRIVRADQWKLFSNVSGFHLWQQGKDLQQSKNAYMKGVESSNDPAARGLSPFGSVTYSENDICFSVG